MSPGRLIEKYNLQKDIDIIRSRVIDRPEIIDQDIQMILSLFPETKKIYQCGSMVTGLYIDSKTTRKEYKAVRRFKRLFYKFKKPYKYSDRDYILEPSQRLKIGQIEILQGARERKLIWEDGNRLF